MDETATGRQLIVQWLNRPMCIQLTDGRKVVGTFLCTDNDCNIILGQTREYWPINIENRDDKSTSTTAAVEEPRLLGLTMVPGRHIVSISINLSSFPTNDSFSAIVSSDSGANENNTADFQCGFVE